MDEQQLNFNQAELAGVVEQGARVVHPVKDFVLPILVLLIFLYLLFRSYKKTKDNRFVRKLLLPKIRNWPLELKSALFILILSYLFTHIFAAGSVFWATRVSNQAAELYFKDLGIGRLLNLSHAHLFAHATMYFVMAVLVHLCEGSRLLIGVAPVVALWSGVFDVISWWGSKLVSPNFELLSALSGSLFSLAFVVMFALLFKNICRSAEES